MCKKFNLSWCLPKLLITHNENSWDVISRQHIQNQQYCRYNGMFWTEGGRFGEYARRTGSIKSYLVSILNSPEDNWAMTYDFLQYGILTSVDSGQPVQPPFKLRNSTCCSASSWTFIEYASNLQRLWSGYAYAQAGLSVCWWHMTHCSKSHVTANIVLTAAEVNGWRERGEIARSFGVHYNHCESLCESACLSVVSK